MILFSRKIIKISLRVWWGHYIIEKMSLIIKVDWLDDKNFENKLKLEDKIKKIN